MPPKQRVGLSRRKFLFSTVGALAAARGVASAEPSTESNGVGNDSAKSAYDVIVIGAGFAGVTAARELRAAGMSTLIIEARNRVGGRTFTGEFDGRPADLGGTWIHWSQPYVWAEKKRYGLELEETPGATAEEFIYESAGKVTRSPMSEIWTPLNQGVTKFFEPSREVFPRPHSPFYNDSYREVDSISGLQRLRSIGLTEKQQDLVNGYFSTTGHNSLSEIAWIELMRCYALSGHNLLDLNDALARYRFRDGTAALLDAMLEEASPDILLASPVASIKTNSDGVEVVTEGGRVFRARAAVVTVPLNVLKDVSFSPPILPGKILASKETHAGVGTKFHALIRGKQGNIAAAAPTTSPQPITYLFTEHEGETSTHMIGFGPDPQLLNVANRAQVEGAIRKFLPDVEVEQVLGYQWNLDPFSQGTWSLFRPKQYGRYLRDLQEPEGHLFFASSDWADGWRGFIDGAIESGITASRGVKRVLG